MDGRLVAGKCSYEYREVLRHLVRRLEHSDAHEYLYTNFAATTAVEGCQWDFSEFTDNIRERLA